MTPVNFFNRSLVSYALGKPQRSLRNFRGHFSTKESQQRSTYTDGQQQKQVKPASNKMRFHDGASSLHRSPPEDVDFTQVRYAMSGQFCFDVRETSSRRPNCVKVSWVDRLLRRRCQIIAKGADESGGKANIANAPGGRVPP